MEGATQEAEELEAVKGAEEREASVVVRAGNRHSG